MLWHPKKANVTVSMLALSRSLLLSMFRSVTLRPFYFVGALKMLPQTLFDYGFW